MVRPGQEFFDPGKSGVKSLAQQTQGLISRLKKNPIQNQKKN